MRYLPILGELFASDTIIFLLIGFVIFWNWYCCLQARLRLVEYWIFSPGLLCLECGSVDRIVAGYESVVRDILAQMPADACGKWSMTMQGWPKIFWHISFLIWRGSGNAGRSVCTDLLKISMLRSVIRMSFWISCFTVCFSHTVPQFWGSILSTAIVCKEYGCKFSGWFLRCERWKNHTWRHGYCAGRFSCHDERFFRGIPECGSL